MRKQILSVAATFMVAYVAIAQGTTYCISKGLNSNYEFISRVRIRQIVLHLTKQSSRSVDVSALQPGIYLLIVETDQGLIRNKFVKE